ncbi:hypothetical protein BHM03_00037203, partial [Ensete ventricosum]
PNPLLHPPAPSPLPLRKQRRCALRPAAPLLRGGDPYGQRRRPLRVHRGQPLASWLPMAVPYRRVAGNRPYWLVEVGRARGWPPLASGRPLQVAGSPLAGGPWLQPAAPCSQPRPTPPPRRSYIPVFQIRMEKMKEVKRPPL